MLGLRQNSRRRLSYVSVTGKVFLFPRSLQLGDKSRLARTKKIPLQLPSPHPWDFLRETSNLRFLILLHLNPSPPQSRTPFLHPQSLSLRLSAFPLCPTSRLQTLLMTSLPSILQLLLPTALSTLRTGTWKYCVGTHCFESTPVSYPFTRPHFVTCSHKQPWHRQNHLTAVLVSCPQTLPRILPLFSR